MSKFEFVNTIKMEAYAESLTDSDVKVDIEDLMEDRLMKFLAANCVGIDDCEGEFTDEDEGVYAVTIKQYGEGTFYPGCRTLSNGDPGYPDEVDMEVLYDEDVKDLIKEFNKTLESEGIRLVTESVTADWEYNY